MMDLNSLWFVLLGLLLAAYAILDGFDLGVGILSAFATDEERSLMIDSIGPIWDGNGTWLVTFGGGLFSAFPVAYASAFSGFYLVIMLVIWCLMFRAVSLEFRSRQTSKAWLRFWDGAFFLASFGLAFLFGVTLGNLLQGAAIDAAGRYTGRLADLLRPYPLLVGAFSAALLALHGAVYLNLKMDGPLQRHARRWLAVCYGLFWTLYAAATAATILVRPAVLSQLSHHPWGWGIVLIGALSAAALPWAVRCGRLPLSFFLSAGNVAALVFFFGFAEYPVLIPSTLDPAWSLTIYNAASSQRTLGLMRTVFLLGLPFVALYTFGIYRVFRGKVLPAQADY